MIKQQALRQPAFINRFIRFGFLGAVLALLMLSTAMADEPEHVRQSVRALGMGNAFVAVANDENALYYNPAGLQSVQQTIFEILTAGGTTNQNLIDLTEAKAGNTTATIGNLIGTSVYAEINLNGLGVTTPGWGYSIFSNFLFSSVINNPSDPYFQMKTYYQYGAFAGAAWSFMDETLDIGLSIKSVTRNGVQKIVHMFNLLDSGFADDIVDEMKERNRVSPDIGAIYHIDFLPNIDIKSAVVVRNIGGMDFGIAGVIPMTIDLGASAESEIAGLDVLVAVDYLDVTNKLTEHTSYIRNLKIGAEVGAFMRSNGHHALSFRAGINAGQYLSTGFSLNIPWFPMKIDYAVWSEEIGFVAGDKEDRRQSAQISFNF